MVMAVHLVTRCGLLVLGQNPKTELLWLVLGHAIQSDSRDGAGELLG
jgi:hypothetical protein